MTRSRDTASIIPTVDAKGDLLVGTANNTIDNLSPGTNGQLLTANSATATGLEWTTPASTGNAIINGAFDIWQRGTSFSSPASGAYTADRFTHNFDGTGATRTITRELFSPGSAPATSEIGTFHYRYAQTVAGSGGTFLNVYQQYVENVRTFSGQTVTYSIWAKAATAGNYVMGIGQNFGDSGSAFTGAGSKTIAVTTSWQRFDLTLAMPSISGKTVGTNSKLDVYVQATPNTTFTLDIWGIQLEAGAVATPFRRNAPSLQAELAACQRYYWRIDGATNWRIGSGITINTTIASVIIQNPVTMRTRVSAIDFSALGTGSGQIGINDIGAAYSTTSATISTVESSPHSTTVSFGGSDFPVSRPINLGANGGSAFIGFSAEL
jgi:hypothetical protein